MLARRLIVSCVLLCLAQAATAAPARNSLRVEVSNAQVAIDGVTPGAEVVLFGVTIVPVPYSSLTRRHDVLLPDTDRDGRVTHDAPSRGTGIWVAVDASSGAVAVGMPAAEKPQAFDFPPNGLKRSADGKIVRLEERAQTLEFLLVRPGTGAWGATALDGGRSDEDWKNDGTIQITLAGFKSIAGGAAPAHLRGSDIVVVIEPDSLKYSVVREKE